jgi:hypothetical protein
VLLITGIGVLYYAVRCFDSICRVGTDFQNIVSDDGEVNHSANFLVKDYVEKEKFFASSPINGGHSNVLKPASKVEYQPSSVGQFSTLGFWFDEVIISSCFIS